MYGGEWVRHTAIYIFTELRSSQYASTFLQLSHSVSLSLSCCFCCVQLIPCFFSWATVSLSGLLFLPVFRWFPVSSAVPQCLSLLAVVSACLQLIPGFLSFCHTACRAGLTAQLRWTCTFWSLCWFFRRPKSSSASQMLLMPCQSWLLHLCKCCHILPVTFPKYSKGSAFLIVSPPSATGVLALVFIFTAAVLLFQISNPVPADGVSEWVVLSATWLQSSVRGGSLSSKLRSCGCIQSFHLVLFCFFTAFVEVFFIQSMTRRPERQNCLPCHSAYLSWWKHWNREMSFTGTAWSH